MVDIDVIRKRALSYDLILDMETIRYRVSRGDVTFSQRILLTALIKCENEVKNHIMKAVNVEHFGMTPWQFVFEWIIQELHSRGWVDEVELYQKMESYVRDNVLSEYEEIVDQILAIEISDTETVSRAIMLLQKRHAGQVDLVQHSEKLHHSERVILAALIKGDDHIRPRILSEIGEDYFESYSLWFMFGAINQLLKMEDKVEKSAWRGKVRDLVFNHVLLNHTACIDHILAIETPDEKTISKAIAWLHKRYPDKILQEFSS